MTGVLRVGILGSGGIATAPYGVLPNLHHYAGRVEVTAIADVAHDQARATAERFGIPAAFGSLDAMLETAPLDAVVNLTPIPVHAETSRAILDHGKHLASEKPLAATVAEADGLIDLARERGLTIVCAPPDLLYEPYERAGELVRADAIGKVAFARVRSSHAGPGGGPAGWPSDPSWFYREGSGPLLDMGVYGIHEITGLLGPARRVAAFAGITEAVRTVRGGPFRGVEMPVTAPDNCLFMLDFGDSTFAVVDGTFNVHAARSPKVELFGRRGVLNLFRPDGPDLEIYRTDILDGVDGWIEPQAPLAANDRRARYGRALLVGHLADVVLDGARPVLTAEHARHALEIMTAVMESAREQRFVDLTTTF
ncbi:Gfo/Idh/MocA family protein [Streptomyces tsukubensis]|uniref:Oxidoreductase n=1 Tax=Streptomyces tsukubensis TaxID=83656 RepID=A0A1V4AGZ2_9ACTN|nr:Gfo/Idh/MocA family oxidoreductase [Streptomyces tsukubensis]OON82713.1 oxidoreductase [Streptomyces tsukubensis]QFR92112.1 gfo/Idh/MocA family oxidoreductase [Streptomyces tsukubensis]